MIRDFRTVDQIYVGDVYWHIPTGRIFQSTENKSGANDTADFDELTTASSGIFRLDGVLNTAGTNSNRLEFHSDKIVVKDSANRTRVVFGNLS